MTTSNYEKLLAALPDMAEAIKVFDSPEVQACALGALVRAHVPDAAPDVEHRERSTNAKRQSGEDGVAKAKPPQLPQGLSVGEFIAELGAERIVDKVTAIGLFLEAEGADSFTRDDIRQQLQAAREVMPKNLPRDFSATASVRYIAAKSGSTKDFYVTTTGKAAADSRFSAESRKPMPAKRTGRKRPVRAKSS